MASTVVVLTTGGTIASRYDATLGSLVSSLGADEVTGQLRDLPEGVVLRAEAFCNIGSFRMDLPMAFALSRRIADVLAEEDVLGVVVTHGTDTMEESAFLVDLTVGSDKPVVFTGAQRNADQPDADGPRNLGDAVRIAAAPAARGIGTVVAFDSVFHAARDVRKTHTSRPGTFASGDYGKLGAVDGGVVRLYRRPVARPSFAIERVEPRVDLIKMAMGVDDRFMRWALADGTRGFVLEAFGLGNCPPCFVGATADAAAAGVPVLITSRCGDGRVAPLYGNGAGVDLAAAGAIFAGDLSGVKARILLAVLLGRDNTETLAADVALVSD
jgi:L-asparaginase